MTTSRPSPSKSRKRRRRFSFISPTGEIVRTGNLRKFAELQGLRYSNVRSLASGHFETFHGWCSTHPRARERRRRFTQVLVDSSTGEKHMIGQRVTDFCKTHGLALNDTYQLLNGRILCLRRWMLESTYTALGLCPGVDSRGIFQ